MTILAAANLFKTIVTPTGKIEILRGIDLVVNEKETIAVVGMSGSGKTTLLSLLAGLDTPTRGEIHLLNHALHTLSEDERAKCRLGKVGFVFQNFELLPYLTALDNVMLPLMLCRHPHALKEAKMLLTEVGLAHRLHHFPRQLSGGEQQRVAIARAFSTQPQIVFADEPTGCLDLKTGENIIQLLFALNKRWGTTLVFVTHDKDLAKNCHQQYLLERGTLIPQIER
jgi:putative ABC transport system ATP-binding protein